MEEISKKRRDLLVKLELLVGCQCYNGNIQNYAAWGEHYGQGRSFRYPITLNGQNNQKLKTHYIEDDVPTDMVRTGYYAFGANQLHVFRGLELVLKHLEDNYGLKIEDDNTSTE